MGNIHVSNTNKISKTVAKSIIDKIVSNAVEISIATAEDNRLRQVCHNFSEYLNKKDYAKMYELLKRNGENVYIISLLTTQSEQNNITSQYMLAKCYLNGYGTKINEKEALVNCLKAANNNNSGAQRLAGYIYRTGYLDIPQNMEVAFKWTELASKHNDYAKFDLARCYSNGIGVNKNIIKALELYIELLNSVPDSSNLKKTISRQFEDKIQKLTQKQKIFFVQKFYENQSTIEKLKAENAELHIQITYQPGGAGYHAAKSDFETAASIKQDDDTQL